MAKKLTKAEKLALRAASAAAKKRVKTLKTSVKDAEGMEESALTLAAKAADYTDDEKEKLEEAERHRRGIPKRNVKTSPPDKKGKKKSKKKKGKKNKKGLRWTPEAFGLALLAMLFIIPIFTTLTGWLFFSLGNWLSDRAAGDGGSPDTIFFWLALLASAVATIVLSYLAWAPVSNFAVKHFGKKK